MQNQQSTSGGAARPGAQTQASAAAVALDPLRLLRTYYPWLIAAGIAGLIVGVGIWQVLLRVAPKFDSSAVFQAQPPLREELTSELYQVPGGDEAETFMTSEVFRLRSDDLLLEALGEPRLIETGWASPFVDRATGRIDRTEALKAFRDIVSARVIPETQFFQLTVRTGNPVDSAEIARVMMDVYLTDYSDRANRLVRQYITGVDGQVRALVSQIEDLDLQIARLERNNAEDGGVEAPSARDLPEALEIRTLQPKITENRRLRAEAQDQLTEYRRLDDMPGEPVYPDAIGQAARNSQVALSLESGIANQRASYQAQLRLLGDDHPETRRQFQVLTALQDEYDAAVERKQGEIFDAAIQGLTDRISSLDASYEDMLATREELRAKLAEKASTIERIAEANDERRLKVQRLQNRDEQRANLLLLQSQNGRVLVSSAPRIPSGVAFPKPVPIVAVSLVLVFGGTASLIVLKELTEKRVRTPRDISLIPASRSLGVFPELKLDPSRPESIELAARDRPLGAIAEAARELRNEIFKACEARGHRSIVFTAGLPGSGCTSVVTNLAHAAANMQRRVLIVDANLRRPHLHQVYGMEAGLGFAGVLRGEAEAGAAIVPVATNVDLLPAGANAGHAYERFGTSDVTAFLDSVRDRYDLVLFDTAPAAVAADAISLAARCDASVLVCRAFSEKRGLLTRLRHMLGDANADFLGIVVNAVKHTAGGYLRENIKVSTEYNVHSGKDDRQKKAAEPSEPATAGAE